MGQSAPPARRTLDQPIELDDPFGLTQGVGELPDDAADALQIDLVWVGDQEPFDIGMVTLAPRR